MVKNTVAKNSVTTLAVTRVRLAKNRSGTSGLPAVRSRTTNATIRPTPMATGATTIVAPHGWLAAVISPYTTEIRPPVARAAPAMSGRLRAALTVAASALLSSTRRVTAITAKRATGMLTKKIHRHDRLWRISPEITGPNVPPSPATPPKMPSALARSLPSGNSSAVSPNAAGAAMASAAPWAKRLATSIPEVTAAPLSAEATAKTLMPMMNIRLRPTRSASRPPSRSRPPAMST